jgi:multidrug resistance efflux pump
VPWRRETIALACWIAGAAIVGDARDTLRLHGVVEPVNSHPVAAPRLTGSAPGSGPGQLVVVQLARAGTFVRRGDLLVELDRSAQLKAARDREAEYRDILAQIDKKRAEQRIAAADRARDLALADNAVARAELDVLGNDMLAAINAEKNVQALEEARAHLAALRKTVALQERAAAADLRILEIQRERAAGAWQHATRNAEKMRIVSPLNGLVVLKTVWKNGTMAEIQEGEEVRQGIPILEVVDASAMRVRALVNQADVAHLSPGQSARITLDSLPTRTFEGRLAHISPIATTSALSTRVRTFLAVFSIAGTDEHLLPDLAAAIDVTLGAPPTQR